MSLRTNYVKGEVLIADDINAITTEVNDLAISKQDKLISGDNIKTINGKTILGKGDISLSMEVEQSYDSQSEKAQSGIAVAEAIKESYEQINEEKQDYLVSGYNIKTINGQDITGEGNIEINNNVDVNITVDQQFNPKSENAQSGKAVAEAINPNIHNFSFDVETDEITLKNINKRDELKGICTIPEYYQNLPVRQINEKAFNDCNNLTEIIIPDTVATLGSDQFSRCSLLNTIRIGKGITDLNDYLCNECKNLSNIYLTSNITTISYYAFDSIGSDNINIYYNGTIGDWYNIHVTEGYTMTDIMNQYTNLKLHAAQKFEVYSITEFGQINADDISEGTIIFVYED